MRKEVIGNATLYCGDCPCDGRAVGVGFDAQRKSHRLAGLIGESAWTDGLAIMNRLEVDRALGQTPCICGDVESWHPQCYAKFLGRPQHEIDAAMNRAYRTARRKLRERAKVQAGEALMMANVGAERRP